MNVKRFVGKNAREAIALARGTWGDQAVVLSNRPIPGGVEILAMEGAEAPMHEGLPLAAPTPQRPAASAPIAPMSTLSFQDFVRERQRQDSLSTGGDAASAKAVPKAAARRKPPVEPAQFAAQALAEAQHEAPIKTTVANGGQPAPGFNPKPEVPRQAFAATPQPGNEEVLAELKSMRGMISAQLAGMSWFDAVRRSPTQTQLLRLMIGNGFSPSLARQLVSRLPADRDEQQASQWLLDVLARNLHCPDDDAIAVRGGVFALVGPTGVGKTTTTAKIAANFALKHGAASVGLITVDTYRMAASDQLRAFGRILNIPVHTARDSTSLVDLLDLFSNKKLVLIDTVGVGQRDRRLAELFAALPTTRVTRLLVLNATAQAETLEEVIQAYGAKAGSRCVISKLDEAARCGAVVDAAIRHQLVVEGFANGQRVPEDWHAVRPQLLVQKALLKPTASVFTPDDAEMGLMFTVPTPAGASPQLMGMHGA